MWNSLLPMKWVVWIACGSVTFGSALAVFALGSPIHVGGESQGLERFWDTWILQGRANRDSPVIVILEPFFINLVDGRYLRVTIGLELKDALAKALLAQRVARINDALLITLSDQSLVGLQTMEGKARLREALTRQVQAVVPEVPIRTAYFLDFLVHN